MTTIPFFPSTRQVGPSGVEGYCWPVRTQELEEFREAFIRDYATIVRRAKRDNLDGWRGLTVFATYFVAEVLSFYAAQAVVERTKGLGRSVEVPEGYRIWQAVLQGRQAELPGFFEIYVRGMQVKDLSYYLNKYRDKWFGGGKSAGEAVHAKSGAASGPRVTHGSARKNIHRKKVAPWGIGGGIITTKRSGLIYDHAARIDDPVALVDRTLWYGGPVELSGPRKISLFAELVEVVAAHFRDRGVDFPQCIALSLMEFLEQADRVTEANMHRLEQRARHIPQRLWTGTSGNVWDRMLRMAVMDRGGSVTGHAHAYGAEFYVSQFRYFHELMAGNRFVVFGQNDVDLAYDHADRNVLLQDEMPEVITVPAQQSFTLGTPAAQAPVKRIMFVANQYPKDQLIVGLTTPAYTLLDWHARLFHRLVDWGYEVLYKAHPEDVGWIPDFDAMIPGVRTVQGKFEDCAWEVDALMFDNPTSTTFRVAAATGKPVAFLNFDVPPLDERFVEELGQWCLLVHGGYDQDGRMHLEWEELRDGLDQLHQREYSNGFAERRLLLR